MALALQDALKRASDDATARCIVLTGNGKAFSAGQDLGEVTSDNPPGFSTILGEHYNPIISLIREAPKPVIAAVNGVAAGAGANIALACDMVVAAKSASFLQAFSKIGLVPDSGGTWFLPRLIGWGRAMSLMMTGEKVSAENAQHIGMIYQVFEDTVFEENYIQLAKQLSEMPTYGLALTKKLMNESFNHQLSEQLQMEELLQIKAGKSEDYHEGVQAFMQKRKPQFYGR
jgi:2-(1,2-epoxy-1,2-dihydrophenyl)acetyl-CoA isomerase